MWQENNKQNMFINNIFLIFMWRINVFYGVTVNIYTVYTVHIYSIYINTQIYHVLVYIYVCVFV